MSLHRTILPTSLFIILNNIIPLLGISLFGWSSTELFLTFWAETVAIGVVTEMKLFHYRDGFMLRFFPMHFGLFIFCYAFFILMLASSNNPYFRIDNIQALLTNVGFFFVASLLSHLYSYIMYFRLRKEYLHRTPGYYLFLPYARIIPMHISIILSVSLGMGAHALFLLKLLSDLVLHSIEHRSR